MKKVSQNIVSLLLSDVARRVLGFISVVYLARVLGVSLFGTVNIGWTTLAYALALSTVGLGTLGARRIAAGEGPESIPDIVGSRLALSFVIVVVIIIGSVILVRDRVTVGIISIMALSAVVQAFWVDWYFQGQESMAPIARARTLSAAVYVSVVLLFVKQPVDMFWVAGAAVIGDVIAADAMIRRLRRDGVEFRIRMQLSRMIDLLRASAPLAVGGMLAYLSVNLPPIILGMTRGATEVGIYGAASKLVFFLLLGDRILATVLLPASARLHAQSKESAGRMLEQALGWIIVLGLPIAVGGTILGGSIVRLVFGEFYDQSAVVLQIFVWYFVATMVHTVFTTGLIAVGEEKTYGRIMIATAAMYVGTIIAGSIYYGAAGAAVAVVVSEFLSVIVLSTALNRHINVRAWKRLAGSVVCSGGMAVLVFWCREQFIVIPLAAGVAAYGLLAFATQTVTRNDLAALRERL